ncbi:helix-turn-helix domain-containing protein [Amycolatopsis sp. NPDC051061]|uniref:helix-turn-helix domain-containing protein n=1 Tax=Amycolatopsis sp. NPDC051061 TaxID=3155042 RepID=UPI0034491F88
MRLEAEFTSEPFHGEGAPPEHALAARDAAAEAGLETDFGPFGTLARGEAKALFEALPAIAKAALEGGATQVTLQVRRADPQNDAPAGAKPAPGGTAPVELTDALARLIADVEREVGAKLGDLDRPGKQRAVRLLRERGAFGLRKSVSSVADALGVTRFTVYNYLNREAD